ncbi:MAG: hypothetical protein V2A70_03195 [Candidatus Omnitrophota bacterium]
MKRIASVCLSVVLLMPLFSLALAAPQTSGAAAISEIVLSMKELLKLSDAQVRSVTAVLNDGFNQIQLVKAQNLMPDVLERRIKTIQQDQDSQLSNYLSDEQLRQWKNVMSAALQQVGKQLKNNSSAHEMQADGVSKSNFMDNKSLNDHGVLQSGSPKTAQGGVY